VFCCLGTTRADAGSAEKFIKIDQTYVLNSAKIIAEENKPADGSSKLSPVHFLYCSSAVSVYTFDAYYYTVAYQFITIRDLTRTRPSYIPRPRVKQKLRLRKQGSKKYPSSILHFSRLLSLAPALDSLSPSRLPFSRLSIAYLILDKSSLSKL
jgi:hypothetical protein